MQSIIILILVVACAAARQKNSTELIDLGFSSYTIHHTVYEIYACNQSMPECSGLLQTIGIGNHDLNVAPAAVVIRLYDYCFDLFPVFIPRDANNPVKLPIDYSLIFEIIEPNVIMPRNYVT